MRNPGTNRETYFTTKVVHTFFYIKNHGEKPVDKPSSDKLKQKNTLLLGQALHYLPEPLQNDPDRFTGGERESDESDGEVVLFVHKVRSSKTGPGTKYHWGMFPVVTPPPQEMSSFKISPYKLLWHIFRIK